MLKMRLRIFFNLCLACMACMSYADDVRLFSEEAILDNEPPVVREKLVQSAALLEQQGTEANKAWEAAVPLCEASRLGSAEAMYRLGMLYAVGEGVPANAQYAANLFKLASRLGHMEAQKMLDTMQIESQAIPPCVEKGEWPERAPPPLGGPSQAIDVYLSTLPQHKHWVVSLADKVATWHGVDSRLVWSLISAESNFTVSAQSNKQAQGLMQLIPATAERFNVKNAFNASQNIRGGVRYLKWLLAYFEGDVALAVAAYNAGEGNVDKFRGIPPFKETRSYVKKVMQLYGHSHHPFDPTLTQPSPMLARLRQKNG